MRKTYIKGFALEDGISKLFQENGMERISEITEADVIIYKGALDELLEDSSKQVFASSIIPLEMFLLNKNMHPIDLRDQKSLGKRSFEQEDIRGVSDKIGELVDSLKSKEHFTDLARYMKLNGIELAQNALIHKRMSGKEGLVELEIFETGMFYNLTVTDPFGALTHEEILRKLSRVCVERTHENKEAGAGLGLFMVLNASDCVIFRLKKGKQTQVCCIINKYKRLKQFKNKSPALFIFKE